MTEEPRAGRPLPAPSPSSGYAPPSSGPRGDIDVGKRDRAPWIAAGIVATIAAAAVVVVFATAGGSDSVAGPPAIDQTPPGTLPSIPGVTIPQPGADATGQSQGDAPSDVLLAAFPVPPTAVETTDPSIGDQRRWETDLSATTVESFYASELSNLGYTFGPSNEPAAEPATPPGGDPLEARAYDVREGEGALIARVTLLSDPESGTTIVLTAP